MLRGQDLSLPERIGILMAIMKIDNFVDLHLRQINQQKLQQGKEEGRRAKLVAFINTNDNIKIIEKVYMIPVSVSSSSRRNSLRLVDQQVRGRVERSYSRGRSSSRNKEFQRKASNIEVINGRIQGLLSIVNRGHSPQRISAVQPPRSAYVQRYPVEQRRESEGIMAIRYNQYKAKQYEHAKTNEKPKKTEVSQWWDNLLVQMDENHPQSSSLRSHKDSYSSNPSQSSRKS